MSRINGSSFYNQSYQPTTQHCARTQFGSQIKFGAESDSTPSDSAPAEDSKKNWFEKTMDKIKSFFDRDDKEDGDGNKTKRKQDLSISRGIWRTLAKMAPTSPRAIVEWIALFHGVGIVFPIKHFMEGLTGYNSIAIPRVWGRKIWSSRVGRNNDIGPRKTLIGHGLIGGNLWKTETKK